MEKGLMVESYRKMVLIRKFEMCASKLFAQNKLPGFLHLYVGEEAVATGVCSALEVTDYITSTHRGHGHLIAKGGDVKKMMAELFAKETGYCKGKGGSMHISDRDKGILGANGIVGAGIPIATGAAFASKYKGDGRVAVSFFGDGAANRGTFHEALNMAAAFKLPAVFVCENNLFAISVCARYHMAISDISDRAAAYGMPGYSIDGNDVELVYETTKAAVERARRGEGPTLIECKTWRHRGHYEGDPDDYRTAEEKAEWMQKDPIERLAKRLIEEGICTQAELDAIASDADKLLAEAIDEAEAAPVPSVSALMADIYKE
ncbi:MAG TPA: thiamine pyrophosphate-dependent dehydrogenase E1 component subunit alpha [Candidatus Scatomorpha merdavium]|jgi:pyruvate dehydrogenase E1 component alpha subunit|nr:thiamine pyrophosphate-dependent dehydrogenase E1 component subunit alpha [Candidatus Scatomorpha merdavium]